MAARTEDRSLGELFAELSRETTALVRKEIELARTEMTEKLSDAGKNVALLAAGGAVLYAALLFLLAAVTLLLAEAMSPWLAALLVAVVVAVIGFVLVQMGRSALKKTSLVPEKTVETLKEDKEWVQQQAK